MNTKEICFRLDKSGAVGESLLHLCMLNGTVVYHELAKRLIKHFPKMINDIYLSEDYYGNKIDLKIVSKGFFELSVTTKTFRKKVKLPYTWQL